MYLNGLGLVGYLIELGIIVVVGGVLDIAISWGLRAVSRRKPLEKQRFPVGWARAAITPIRLLIYLFALTFLVDTTYTYFAVEPVPIEMGVVRQLILILVSAWFVLRWKSINERHFRKAGDVSEAQLQLASKLVVGLVGLVTLLLLLQTLGLHITSLLAVGGFGALALGMAAKDVLSNFFSGAMIYVTHPFRVGDLIECPGKDMKGTVERIGWYLSVIRGLDKRPMFVPNQIFSTAVVINQTRIGNRRIFFTLGLRYGDLEHVEAIVADIKALLREHPQIDTDQSIIVNLTEYAASSVNLLVQAFMLSTDGLEFLALQQELLLKVAKIVQAHGADFAFPTITLDTKLDTRSSATES